MAKIEMDISEYEALKENKKLLEQSLEKERNLQEQVKQLNDEKISALEEAKMKVVKVVNTKKTEHVYSNKSFSEVLEELSTLYNLNKVDKTCGFIPDNMINMFFTKTVIEEEPTVKITTHGLDEVKQEIEEKVRKSLGQKIIDAENGLVEVNKIKQSNVELCQINNTLLKSNKDLSNKLNEEADKINELQNKIDELSKKLSDRESILQNVKSVVKEELTFLNGGSLFKKIRNIVT